MEAAGELPKADVQPERRWANTEAGYGGEEDPRKGRYYSGDQESTALIAASPTGGETPREAIASWEAKAQEGADPRQEGYYTPAYEDMQSVWDKALDVPDHRMSMPEDWSRYKWAAEHGAQFSPEIHQALKAYEAYTQRREAWRASEPGRVDAASSARDIRDTFTTGADDPTRPTRTELPDERAKSSTLPPMTPRAERRQRAADLVMKKHGDGS